MLGARIVNLIRQNGWALNLVFIALGAYFVAGAANAVLARSIRVVPSVDDTKEAKAARHAPSHTAQNFSHIAERNLMGVKRENLTPVEAGAAITEDTLSDTFTEDQLRPCTMSANVRATLVAEGAPEWSSVVLLVNNEPEVFSVNVGSNKVTDDATVVEIRERAVVVRRRDHYELCNADENAPAPMATRTDEAPPQVASSEAGVTKVNETSYNIERGEIDNALNNINEIATQARIVPSFKNGKANGFKLFSIKPGSIFSKIGMQNGDVIQKINGYEMSSPDKALEIYQKLKDSTSITIDLQRRGQPMNFSYNIGG